MGLIKIKAAVDNELYHKNLINLLRKAGQTSDFECKAQTH